MKQPFLFGLGVWLILEGVVLGLGGDTELSQWGSIAAGFIGVFLGGLSIAAARRCYPSYSRAVSIFGWLLAFFASGFVLAPFVIGIIALQQTYAN